VEICANVKCGKQFTKVTFNNIYCSPECCQVATNAKIMERYYANKKKRDGSERFCESCASLLSRYNFSDHCSACTAKQKTAAMNNVKRILG